MIKFKLIEMTSLAIYWGNDIQEIGKLPAKKIGVRWLTSSFLLLIERHGNYLISSISFHQLDFIAFTTRVVKYYARRYKFKFIVVI